MIPAHQVGGRAHACLPSTGKVETGESGFQSHPLLHSKSEAKLLNVRLSKQKKVSRAEGRENAQKRARLLPDTAALFGGIDVLRGLTRHLSLSGKSLPPSKGSSFPLSVPEEEVLELVAPSTKEAARTGSPPVPAPLTPCGQLTLNPVGATSKHRSLVMT